MFIPNDEYLKEANEFMNMLEKYNVTQIIN